MDINAFVNNVKKNQMIICAKKHYVNIKGLKITVKSVK